ncbi:MAG: hypothetical protein ACLR0N_14185 [Bilophila wadsworthia]
MLEFTKYLIYASFILNIACGVWVLTGIVQWIAEMKTEKLTGTVGRGCVPSVGGPSSPKRGEAERPASTQRSEHERR